MRNVIFLLNTCIQTKTYKYYINIKKLRNVKNIFKNETESVKHDL